jgi:CheY-like chemotaxis protein
VVRILLVDDDVDGVEAVQLFLEYSGHRVSTAGSAEEALKRVASDPPDVVICDLRLPGMSGEELARELHRRPHPPKLVALSGDRGDTAGGFDMRLEKPCTPKRLARALETLFTTNEPTL